MPKQPAISAHEVRFYQTARALRRQWSTAKALADAARIAPRTARKFTEEYTALGLLTQVASWPAYTFQWNPAGSMQAKEYVVRLEQAARVFAQ